MKPHEIKWLVFGAVGLAGTIYIFAFHQFHLRASTLFASLGWWSIVAAVALALRAGSVRRVEGAHHGTQAGDLDNEKRALLRAMKDLEFDHALGKTSVADFTALMAPYRARIMDVYRSLDAAMDTGGESTPVGREDTAGRELDRELARVKAGIVAAAKAVRK